MKKSIVSTSPFLMLIIPVILFIGLSLALKQSSTSEEISTNALVTKNATATIVAVGQQSIMRFLLKDNL